MASPSSLALGTPCTVQAFEGLALASLIRARRAEDGFLVPRKSSKHHSTSSRATTYWNVQYRTGSA